MYGEICGALPSNQARAARLVSPAEALMALSWLLRRPSPLVRTAGGGTTLDGTARARATRGRLATDPGA